MNLGKASRITFRAACDRRSRSLPAQQTVLSFRPVNHHLQRLHRVSVTITFIYFFSSSCLHPGVTVNCLASCSSTIR